MDYHDVNLIKHQVASLDLHSASSIYTRNQLGKRKGEKENGTGCSQLHLNGNLPNDYKENKEAKRVIQDGFSWWTCLTQGISLDKTKPYSVSKVNSSGNI